MFQTTRITSDYDRAFKDAKRYIGYRIRARLVQFNLAPPGSTGTVTFVVADGRHVFLAVAWDSLKEWIEWYPPDAFLRGVSLEGCPTVAPTPRRPRFREFSAASGLRRIGQGVTTTRRINRSLPKGERGSVSHVVANQDRLMLAVSWTDPTATPDTMWFSRADYLFYLTEEGAAVATR